MRHSVVLSLGERAGVCLCAFCLLAHFAFTFHLFERPPDTMPIPTVVWAQRKDKLYVTIDLQVCCRFRPQIIPQIVLMPCKSRLRAALRTPKLSALPRVQDVSNQKVDLQNADGTGKLTFSGSSNGQDYTLELGLLHEIVSIGGGCAGCGQCSMMSPHQWFGKGRIHQAGCIQWHGNMMNKLTYIVPTRTCRM